MQKRVFKGVTLCALFFANCCNLLIPLDAIRGVVAIEDHSVDMKCLDALGNDFLRLSVKEMEFALLGMDLHFQIFEGFDHKLQAVIAAIGIIFDLLRSKNETENDFLAATQGKVKTRVVFQPQVASEDEKDSIV